MKFIASTVALAIVSSALTTVACMAPAHAGSCTPSRDMPSSCQPYSVNSPFNRTVAQQNPGVSPNSNAWTGYYSSVSGNWFSHLQFGYTNQNNQFQHPIFFSTGSDPMASVSCDANWSNPCTDITTQTYRIPSYARPDNISPGSDAHMSVVDGWTVLHTEVDTWGTNDWNPGNPVTNGVLHAASAGAQSAVNDEGLTYGATGAGFALWAGIIRAQEFANNTPMINHALFIVAPCTSNATPVYPSVWRQSTDTLCPNGQGAPYGAYGRLNLTAAQVNALSIPGANERAIIMALAVYGGYIGDTDNNSGFSVQVEADNMYTLTGTGYTFDGTTCPTNGAPCTPLTAFENHWGNPDWVGDRYSIDLSHLVNFATTWQWLNPPTPR